MSKILRFLTCLFCIVFIGDAVFAAGYECPTYRQYTSCNEGYYLAHSYTGTSYDSIRFSSTPRAGNACRPCTDYDNYYDRPEGSYYCEGGKKAPVLNKVTITYKLNGGSGTTPDSELCTKGQPCTLNDGATNTFYRAGYVFKGWALTSDATSGFTSYTFTAADTVYAVWEKCGLGEYKPGSGTRASAACSSCPELTTGFEYWRPDTTLPSSVSSCVQAVIDPSGVDSQCASRDPSRPAIMQIAASDDAWGRMMAGVLVAKPGAYLNFQTSQVIPEGTDLDNLCTECGVGTYSEGGDVTSCSACPELTPGFEYRDLTGMTSINSCMQYNYDPSVLNNKCTTANSDDVKIIIRASAETGDWATYAVSPTEGAVYAVPGAYVNPDMMTNGEYLDISGFDASNLCIACTVGTFSPGGDVHSCSACPSGTYSDAPGAYECTACPELTTGFEYVPTTGNTSLTACKQGLKNPADINEFCEAASGTAEAFKIQCVAASDDTWGNCVPTGAPFDAKPGSYVGITSQSQPMPIEDVVENICKQCKDGTWSYGEDVTSCSACPALRPADEQAGWKISSGGDGATRVQDCYAYLESYPTNCASGSFKRMYRGDAAAGYYESQWFEWEPLTAKPGYMVQFEDGQTTAPACVECSAGTYSPGGDVHSCSECPDLPTGFAYASITGLKKKTQCLAAAANVGLLNENCRDEITSAPVRLVVGAEDDTDWTLYYTVPTTTSMIRANPGAYVNPEILTDGTWQPYSNFNADELCKLCQAGTYNGDMSQTVTSCTACPTGYDDNPETGLTSPDMCQINCPGGYYLAAANDATCSEVSPGYWAAEKIVNYGDTSTRTECASGLTTIGYGAGADEAADCGRVLHFGNDTLYLRSVKKTDHALHVGINGTVFYGNMGTDLSKGSLRIKLGDTTYSVYDDNDSM